MKYLPRVHLFLWLLFPDKFGLSQRPSFLQILNLSYLSSRHPKFFSPRPHYSPLAWTVCVAFSPLSDLGPSRSVCLHIFIKCSLKPPSLSPLQAPTIRILHEWITALRKIGLPVSLLCVGMQKSLLLYFSFFKNISA